MSTAVILEPNDLDKLIAEMKETLRGELTKVISEVREAPMTTKETAKYLKCTPGTLSKSPTWRKLRHMIDGRPYWFASELDQYIRQQ